MWVNDVINFEVVLVDTKNDKEFREILLIALFVLWRERCTRIFQERSKNVEELAEEVKTQWNYTNRRMTT